MTRRILFTSTAGAGHVGPVVAAAEAAQRRGNDVLVIVPAEAERLVGERGLPVLVGGEPDPDELASLRAAFASAPPEVARRLMEVEIFAKRCAEAMLPAVRNTVTGWQPDLLVREPCEYASAVAAASAGLPVKTIAISFSAGEWSVLDLVSDVLEEYEPGLTDLIRSSPFLTRFPESLDPSPFPLTVRYREPLAAPSRSLPEEWWPDRSLPLVYVTFGTVVSGFVDPVPLWQTVFDALGPLDARILATVGRSVAPARLGPAPANTRVETWIPQSDVLPFADVVVCHGGSGTTWAAMGAGVPVVFVPFLADQPANARAVAGAGAGLVLERSAGGGSGRFAGLSRDEASHLGELVQRVLGEPAFRVEARRLQAELSSPPLLEDLLSL